MSARRVAIKAGTAEVARLALGHGTPDSKLRRIEPFIGSVRADGRPEPRAIRRALGRRFRGRLHEDYKNPGSIRKTECELAAAAVAGIIEDAFGGNDHPHDCIGHYLRILDYIIHDGVDISCPYDVLCGAVSLNDVPLHEQARPAAARMRGGMAHEPLIDKANTYISVGDFMELSGTCTEPELLIDMLGDPVFDGCSCLVDGERMIPEASWKELSLRLRRLKTELFGAEAEARCYKNNLLPPAVAVGVYGMLEGGPKDTIPLVTVLRKCGIPGAIFPYSARHVVGMLRAHDGLREYIRGDDGVGYGIEPKRLDEISDFVNGLA